MIPSRRMGLCLWAGVASVAMIPGVASANEALGAFAAVGVGLLAAFPLMFAIGGFVVIVPIEATIWAYTCDFGWSWKILWKVTLLNAASALVGMLEVIAVAAWLSWDRGAFALQHSGWLMAVRWFDWFVISVLVEGALALRLFPDLSRSLRWRAAIAANVCTYLVLPPLLILFEYLVQRR